MSYRVLPFNVRAYWGSSHYWVFGPTAINDQGDFYNDGTYVEPAGWTLEALTGLVGLVQVVSDLDPDLLVDEGL